MTVKSVVVRLINQIFVKSLTKKEWIITELLQYMQKKCLEI